MSVGLRAKKNHIFKYYEQNYNSCEILEDTTETDPPALKFQTKDRIITLTTDDNGNVIEDFRMRRGSGLSKQQYLAKQAAFEEIKKYCKKTYKNIPPKKEDFDNTEVKIQLPDENITVSYDFKKKEIVVKSRKRNIKAPQEKPMKPEKLNKAEKVEKPKKAKKLEKTEKPEAKVRPDNKEKLVKEPVKESVEESDIPTKPTRRKTKLQKDDRIRNIFNNQLYTVVKAEDNVIYATDENHLTLVMALSDLKKV